MIRFGRWVLAGLLVASSSPAYAQYDAGSPPPFDPAAFRQYLGRGHEIAVGHLVVTLSDGTLVSKRGATVLALPDSAYTRWWLATSATGIRARSSAGSFDDAPIPEQLKRFARYAVTGSAGDFEVDGLPRGRYLFRGRLSIAFPRAVVTPTTPNPYAAYGYDNSSFQRNPVVFDYTVVWLDSASVRVGAGPPEDIAFHLVARRDRVDPHRS